MKFYLGTHMTHWLAVAGVPLFVSRRRLALRKSLPRAIIGWALDSGGFSEISLHGGWKLSPRAYVAEVIRYRDEIGLLEWAAIQDWMCEPWMLQKTGLSVERHQQLTIESYSRLLDLAPDLPWTPVLQGWGGTTTSGTSTPTPPQDTTFGACRSSDSARSVGASAPTKGRRSSGASPRRGSGCTASG